MSHSKHTKRDYSIYIEKWDKSSKKYINTCAICGHKGYSPVVEEEGFCQVTFKELPKTLRKLELDEYGRCTYCARVKDKQEV